MVIQAVVDEGDGKSPELHSTKTYFFLNLFIYFAGGWYCAFLYFIFFLNVLLHCCMFTFKHGQSF